MTRKITAAAVVALAASLIAAHPAGAQDMRARLGHVFGSDSSLNEASRQFATCVGKNTDGAIDIAVFPDGQLGGDESMARDMARGGQEIGFVNPGSLTGLDPLLDIHYLPYIVSNYEQADAIFYNPDGTIQKTLRAAMEKHGMHVLDFYEVEFRAVTNSVRPVENASDLAGLKLRVPSSASIRNFFEAARSQAVTLPFPELFVALQQGTVDGQDNGVSLTYNSRLFETQKYMTLTNHVYAIGAVAVSDRFWQRLSDDQKSAMFDCAASATKEQIAENRATQQQYLAQIKDAGVEVIEPEGAALGSFIELGRAQWGKLENVYGADRLGQLRAEVAANAD